MKKENFVVVIVVLLIVMSVGYAAFSETITITGTSTANGNFDVGFSSATVTSEVGSTGASATIEPGSNQLTINVPKLEYPGAYALITVNVKNFGSIPAELISLDEKGVPTDPNIVISYPGLVELKNKQITQGNVSEFQIKVMWKAESTAASKNVEFTLKLNYKQSV